MSFLAPKIETRGLAQATPGRIADWREAEALPFGNGYFRVAPKWITDRFNDHWSNGSQTGQAFTSIAGWLCHGPVDRIRAIYNNGEIHLILEVAREPGQYYTEFTFGGIDRQLGVTNRGRIYWGLEDQPADAWLSTMTGQDHPPYPGICYIIFERLHLGEIRANTQAKPAIPNIEVSLSRLPSPHLPEDLRLPADVTVNPTSGVNWVSALYDALTHPRAGLDAAHLLDTAEWEAAALAVQNGTKTVGGRTGPDAYLSPLHTDRQDLEQVIADYLSYVDGFTYARNGLVAVDWFPNDGSAAGSLPEIGEADMSDDPEISDSTLADAPSTIVVKGLSDIDLEAAAEPYPVQLVRALHGDHRTVQLDRPWIVERVRLRMYGAQYAAKVLTPRASGRLSVLRPRAVRLDGTALRPGDRFRLLWPKQGRDLVCRVIEREEQELGAVVTLLFRSETGNVVNPVSPDGPAPYTPPEMGTYPCDDFAVYRAPLGLGNGAVVLARRSQPNYANLAVLIDADGSWSGGSQTLGQQAFAAQGVLQGAIGLSDATLTVFGEDEDLGPTLGSGMSGSEQADNTMLLVIGNEWMSVGGVTSVAPDTYQIAVARGRLGSFAAAHADTAVVRIIRRADLPVWSHTLISEGGTRSFKVKALGGGGTESALSCSKDVEFPGGGGEGGGTHYSDLIGTLPSGNIAASGECRPKTGQACFCGHPEFGDPSDPPRFYKLRTTSGTMTRHVWESETDCPTKNACGAGRPEFVDFSATINITHPFSGTRSFECTIRAYPILRLGPTSWRYQYEASLNDLSGDPTPWVLANINVPVAGDLPASGGTADQDSCPVFSGDRTVVLKLYDQAVTTWYAGETAQNYIAPPADSPDEEILDSWDIEDDYAPAIAAAPPLVCVPTTTDNSTRTDRGGDPESGPFASTPPVAYDGDSDVSVSPTNRTTDGDGECKPDGLGGSYKLVGSVAEVLTDEDTPADVIERAMGGTDILSVPDEELDSPVSCWWTDVCCTALFLISEEDACAVIREVKARGVVHPTYVIEGREYRVRLVYGRRPIASGDFADFAFDEVTIEANAEQASDGIITEWFRIPNDPGFETRLLRVECEDVTT